MTFDDLSSLLLGEMGACGSLVCPNAKLILRTLAIVHEQQQHQQHQHHHRQQQQQHQQQHQQHQHQYHQYQAHTQAPPPTPPQQGAAIWPALELHASAHDGAAIWPALERWVDPVLLDIA